MNRYHSCFWKAAAPKQKGQWLAETAENLLGRPSESLWEDAKAQEAKTADPRSHSVILDALRGIAILLVVFSHIGGFWTAGTKIPLTIQGVDVLGLLSLGAYGVPLFFLLSGYLLTWTETSRLQKGLYSVRSYALRRVLRLVPAYYAMILVLVIVGMSPISLMDVLMHLTFLHTLNPYTAQTVEPIYWSLTPEVTFYLLLPLIILKLPRLWQRIVLFVVFYVVHYATQVYIEYLMREGVAQGMPPAWQPGDALPLDRHLLMLPSNYLWLFLAGVLIRMLFEHLSERPVPWWRPPLLAAVVPVGIVMMLNLQLHIGFLDQLLTELRGGRLVFIDLVVIILFIAAVLGTPLLRRVLNWRFLSFVGIISYSLFLIHEPVVSYMSAHILPDVGKWAQDQSALAIWMAFTVWTLLILVLTGVLSYLSYRIIESPFLSIKPK